MKRIFVLAVLLVWAGALAGLAVLNASTPVVEAHDQGAHVVQQPVRQSSSDVQWKVLEDSFISNYPNGFTMRIKVTSSGGDIVSARMKWLTANQRETTTTYVYSEEAELNADKQTFDASWEPTRVQMLPPWSALHYYWELRDSAGNTYQTEPVFAEYADETHNWSRSESDEAIVFSYGLPDSINQLTLDGMTAALDQYITVWGAQLPYKPRIVLFGDYDAWKEWRTLQSVMEQNIVGQTFDEWGVIAQVIYGSDMTSAMHELAYSTVPHELEHLYQAEFMWPTHKTGDIPAWFTEGDATFFEVDQSYDYLQNVRYIAASGNLPPLLVNMGDAPDPYDESGRDVYDIGYSFFAWLQMKSGGNLNYHHDLMALLAQNVPFFTAIEQVTGMSIADVESDWRVWLGASAQAPTLIPTWTPAAIPLIVTPSM